jgi:hypothetical protein
VLIKRWKKTFDDGSSITLGTGEPVVPLDAGGVAFRVDGVVLHADVPAASIGRSYAAITPAALVPGDAHVQLHAGAAAKVAGQTYTAPTKASLVHAAATTKHPHKDVSRFPIRTRCGEVDVVVPDDAVEAYKPPAEHAYYPMGQDGYLIPKGTPLETRAKRRAGVASEGIAVGQPSTETVCFKTSVGILVAPDVPADLDLDYPGQMELCAPGKVVQRVP